MSLFLCTIIAGALLGVALGGHPRGITRLRLAWPGLAIAAGAFHLATGWLPADLRWSAVIATMAVVGAWLVVNARRNAGGVRIALLIVTLGWTLNFAVMAANGGMPVSKSALERAGLPTSSALIRDGSLYKHVPETANTHLRVLDDHLTFSFPVSRVLSWGDAVMLVGMALLAFSATRLGTHPVRGGARATAPAGHCKPAA